ncbi:hypothetical protein RhiirA5_494146 [Rhizophagus irregularis]|uniref:Uncharacterized protein n=4 Tax=Rhizophagus irregularis TaxID=588596 RepID=A0A2I1ETF3_9GLOM|nr:hypothetical protein RirG_101280 [Rhizophagus irregularis DAOM 197198w]PKC15964.1 hypothetical protein RhiirA5_494146 [Rhizophagus irregularis]GBC18234.1 interferon alpha-inducible protein 27-like protein 2 [Rhizophagus irregularis DAOM 181602=DAOM 197198]PKC72982.1 hypothetical protein RhiirA1_488689 [Rhizophagus irregularis]PKY25355.1 hypothetical protein RhiirB3_472456 [Rhizophagus irregularis]
MYLSDKKLLAIVLYSAFVNNEFLIPVRDTWDNPWIIGTSGALAIGFVGALVAPIILSAIIYGLGFGVEGIAANSFASWFMSLYGGTIARGSLISILQSVGAAGLGTLGTFLSSSFGAAIGILIGAIGGSNLASYLKEMDLTEFENQILESLVQIEENIYQNNSIVIFTLMPLLLSNSTMLKCFAETFISCSPFVNSKLFRFDFKDINLLKSDEGRVNYIVNNLLIGDYNKTRAKYIFHDDYLIGYNLNLSDHEPSNLMLNMLVEIWNILNGNIIVDFGIDNIRNQINDEIHNLINYFHDKVHL